MTASEFGFLAIGLVLGLMTGAAVVEVIRARPHARREVRLTVSHDAIPRRAVTLADDAFTSVGPEPARGGPADRRFIRQATLPAADERRTPVRSQPIYGPTPEPSMRGAIPIGPEPVERERPPVEASDVERDRPIVAAGRPPDPRIPVPGRVMEPALPLVGPRHDMERYESELIGIPISGGKDPSMLSLAQRAVAAGASGTRPVEATGVGVRVGEVGVSDLVRSSASGGPSVSIGPSTSGKSTISGDGSDPIEPAPPRATLAPTHWPAPMEREDRTGRAEQADPERAGGRGRTAVEWPEADLAARLTRAEPDARSPWAVARGMDVVMDEEAPGRVSSAIVATPEPPVSTEAPVAGTAGERCAEERRIADERCELSSRARERAETAANALRSAQRAYDGHEAAAVTASWRADPRAVHEAKDQAQGGFKAAVRAATTPDQLESAARDWLTEINRINSEARDAAAAVAREHKAASTIGATLERLGLEADAARISAETADAACLAARAATAECEELASRDPSAVVAPTAPPERPGVPRPDDDELLGSALEAGGTPRIFRLLRGDRAAMNSLIAALADTDREERRRWQLQMTNLVEAIVANAIEVSALDFPAEHELWGEFPRSQNRDIVHALSSLGYRFDGLGGWTDGRHPSQRDLSLALGYAGLDPMRLRRWPNDAATQELFRDVTVAADEYLAEVAGDLTLAEMVAMLGRRADGLAEVWNQWGTLRPLLLDES